MFLRASLQGVTVVGVVGIALFVRSLVALHPHSGQGNPPTFGDFEAQRHWVEITNALPRYQWYSGSPDNDLRYWGLAAPPIAAFHSLLIGLAAKWSLSSIYAGTANATAGDAIYQSMFGLHSSRGSESPATTFYMRLAALAADWAIYFPAAILVVRFLSKCAAPSGAKPVALWNSLYWTCFASGTSFLLLLLAFPLILVDHAHFQFYAVALGLVLWFFLCAIVPRRYPQSRLLMDATGIAAYLSAVFYKQASLYYLPAVAVFYFGEATTFISPRRGAIARLFGFALLSVFFTVVASFCVLVAFGPFVDTVRGSPPLFGVEHVLARVLPSPTRSSSEGNAASVWCLWKLSGAVAAWKKLPETDAAVQSTMLQLCTLLSIFASMPSCIALLRFVRATYTSLIRFNSLQHGKQLARCLGAASLSFYLFSYDATETSILLPWLPVSLLCVIATLQFVVTLPCDARRVAARRRYSTECVTMMHFSVLALFSMYPLFRVDRLYVAYLAAMVGLGGCVVYAATHLTIGRPVALALVVSITAMVGFHALPLVASDFDPQRTAAAFRAFSCIHFFYYLLNLSQRCWMEASNAVRISEESRKAAAAAQVQKRPAAPKPEAPSAERVPDRDAPQGPEEDPRQFRAASVTPQPQMGDFASQQAATMVTAAGVRQRKPARNIIDSGVKELADVPEFRAQTGDDGTAKKGAAKKKSARRKDHKGD